MTQIRMIGGKNNWRTHRPYRPITLDPPPSKSEVVWIKLGIIAGVITGLGAYYYGY